LSEVDIKHWLAPPAPRPKFYSAQDAVHLEDESGRVRLVGERIRREREREGGGLVTGELSPAAYLQSSSTIGVIMAALGMETSSGDFEVIDLCFAGLPDIYTPKSSSSTNVKGKAKAKEDDSEQEGTASLL